MALQKLVSFKGIDIQAYHKITKIESYDYEDDDGIKKYFMIINIVLYTDNTKQYDLEGKQYNFRGLNENELTREKAYLLLKSIDEFKESIEC